MIMVEDPDDVSSAAIEESPEAVMRALRGHVPLSLLVDIVRPNGPGSAEIAAVEGGTADWLETP